MNDNAPVFDSPSYSTSISESSTTKGARVFAVKALDKDKRMNAAIVYTLTENPGGFFEIDPDSGIIYLKKTVSGVRTFTCTGGSVVWQSILFLLTTLLQIFVRVKSYEYMLL